MLYIDCIIIYQQMFAPAGDQDLVSPFEDQLF